MNVCDSGHDAICYEGNGECPMCEIEQDKFDLQKEVGELEKRIDKLEEQNAILKERLEE